MKLRAKILSALLGVGCLGSSLAGAQTVPPPKPWYQPSGWAEAGVGYLNTTYDFDNHYVADYWGIRLDWVSRGVIELWTGICDATLYPSDGYLHPTARIELWARIPYNFTCRIDGHQITRVSSQGVRTPDGILNWDADGWNAGGHHVHLLATNFPDHAQIAIGN